MKWDSTKNNLFVHCYELKHPVIQEGKANEMEVSAEYGQYRCQSLSSNDYSFSSLNPESFIKLLTCLRKNGASHSVLR